MSMLLLPGSICSQCNGQITTNYVKCEHCSKIYHFSPCTVLSETTYNSMNTNKKAEWKCHQCEPRNNSPNNTQQKPQQSEDNNTGRETGKRFRNALVPIAANNTVMSPTVQKSDTVELKSDMTDLKTTMQQIAQSMAALTTSNNEIREQLTNALAKVNETLSNLTVQVNNLEEREKEKNKRLVRWTIAYKDWNNNI